MLKIEVPVSPEGWDEVKEEFVDAKTVTLELEHSLVSVSKWESKWCKAFLSKRAKTDEETVDYIKCMTLNDVSSDVYEHLSRQNIDKINKYIEAPMTATHISEPSGGKGGKRSSETVTSELIYYWMFTLGIPLECQNWHFNRLMTLVNLCSAKNTTSKPRSQAEIAKQYAALNAARRKKYNTKG